MEVKILDCTLRDGGYNNDWNFGKTKIKNIISDLEKSQIDIIELGYLKKIAKSDDFTIFNSIEKVSKLIIKNSDKIFTAMMQINSKELSLKDIPQYKNGNIQGIRLAFNQNEATKALKYCKELEKKGYKVFLHPCKITLYSETKLINLIKKVNKIIPYALYIVDSFGAMDEKQTEKIFRIFDKNLNKQIIIGFHSHNNLELSFSNAKTLINLKSKRTIIIDSSIYQMGRGAGNLATETVIEYLNKIFEKKYKTEIILKTYKNNLSGFYKKHPWGSAEAYYLSGLHNCHPDYASFLINKKIASKDKINKIYEQIPLKEKKVYNRITIEKILRIERVNGKRNY